MKNLIHFDLSISIIHAYTIYICLHVFIGVYIKREERLRERGRNVPIYICTFMYLTLYIYTYINFPAF
jgi:hypothetical protein